MRAIAIAAIVSSTLIISGAAMADGPIGYWMRTPDQSVGFTLSRGAKGAWVVETHGTPQAGKPANACWNVYVGTMNGSRLVFTADLPRNFSGQLRADGFLAGEGLFVDFDGRHARLSGPEAHNKWCQLEGEYTHLPGPIIGDPPK
jgi:hypothetical protein